MIEHLFMLRCILWRYIPQSSIYVMTMSIAPAPSDEIFQYLHRRIMHTLPFEATSLKDNPHVIQCEECGGIFPDAFIHIRSIFNGGQYVTRIDLCEACWKGLGR